MTKNGHSRLWLYFSGIISATVFTVFTLVSIVWFSLYEMGIIQTDIRQRRIPLLVFALGSILLGTVTALFVGKLIIKPMQNIGSAFSELSKGNFDVKISENERIIEIRQIAESFNAMTYDLSHIETLRNDFVANVSHEFKTPIAAIEGYATLLQSKNLPPEKHDRYVEKILENSRRLSNLSGNILALSKLENRETMPDIKEFRLDEQIRKCILMLENEWSQKQIEFDLTLARTDFTGSQSLLEQVWLNILDNAIKHSPEKEKISVKIDETDERVSVCVSDFGEGMTPDVQKHIFEKFFQGDTSRQSEGNGLGLALVKRIVELSKGSVEVESSPGNGAEFTVILPKNIF